MRFPRYRPRRLREHIGWRHLVQETTLAPTDFILPLFVTPGSGVRQEISSMPGQYHLSVDQVVEEGRRWRIWGFQPCCCLDCRREKMP